MSCGGGMDQYAAFVKVYKIISVILNKVSIDKIIKIMNKNAILNLLYFARDFAALHFAMFFNQIFKL